MRSKYAIEQRKKTTLNRVLEDVWQNGKINFKSSAITDDIICKLETVDIETRCNTLIILQKLFEIALQGLPEAEEYRERWMFIHQLFEIANTAFQAGVDHSKKHTSKMATDIKYAPGREIYKEALEIAQRMWEEGSLLKHHQMKRFLVKEYQNGISEFAKFDVDCGYTDKGLLNQLKALANEMNRPDLISGLKINR
jgi:hypothetical protein